MASSSSSSSTPLLKIDGVVVNYVPNSLSVIITRTPVNVTTFGSAFAQYGLGVQRFEIEFETIDTVVGRKMQDAIFDGSYLYLEFDLGGRINKAICRVRQVVPSHGSVSMHAGFHVVLVGDGSTQTSAPHGSLDGMLEEAADMLKQLLEEAPEVYTDILLSLINDSDTECLILDPVKVAAAGRSSDKIKISVVENKLVLTAEMK